MERFKCGEVHKVKENGFKCQPVAAIAFTIWVTKTPVQTTYINIF